MKISSLCFIILLFVSSLFSNEEKFYPRLRPDNEFEFPLKFRTTQNYESLEKLNASASGQFSENSFLFLAKTLPAKNIIVIDLRREFHGFVNGCALSWKLCDPKEGSSYEYNFDLSSEEIEKTEKELLSKELSHDKSTFYFTDTGVTLLDVDRVATERELVENLGHKYFRFPTLDHHYPLDLEVDQFVDLIKSLPDVWVHFHCAGGEGRTTVFMCMLDMMRNSHLSPEAIMRRQEALGGANLYDPVSYYAKKPTKIIAEQQRYQFLCHFHKYCVENPNFERSWSEWKQDEFVMRSSALDF